VRKVKLVLLGIATIVLVFSACTFAEEFVLRFNFTGHPLRVTDSVESHFVWEWFPVDKELDNFVLETRGRPSSDDMNTRWGLLWGLDYDNFYVLWMRPDGYFQLALYANGSWRSSTQWEKSRHILTGTSSNTVRMEFIGKEMQLYVNDEPIYKRLTNLEGSWNCALAVWSANDESATAYFDWLEIRSRE